MRQDDAVVEAAQRIGKALYHENLDEALGGHSREHLLGSVRRLAEASFAGDRESELHMHRLLYRMNTASLARPWEQATLNVQHPFIHQARSVLEEAWERRDLARHAESLQKLPPAEQFPEWIKERVRAHGSNVSHPLFAFLRERATFQQLRMFFLQETPFDIFFGDILLMMMPGIYGGMKQELCLNFWDEMGHGEVPRMHRSLRLRMMEKLDIAADHHLTHVEDYYLEELRLANMYFDSVLNRRKLPQAIGMMLATELMVPGRLDHQIEGWRRVHLKDEDMVYLLEHCVVDIEHSRGWMNNVVIPLLRERPMLMRDLTLGVERRLENAGAVCDKMLTLFDSQNSQAHAG